MISKSDIHLVHQKAHQLKAVVIGDAMLDRYIYGTVDRISPEAPVPILSHQNTELKAGGSANVALNLAAWGCQTSLIGLTGNDSNAGLLVELLEKQHIGHHLIKSASRPTTIKTRIVASSHHLLRIDEESTDYLTGDEEQQARKYILTYLETEQPDLIILEDYNKGLLTESIIASVIQYGKGAGAFIAVDPKEQNFFGYTGVQLFKPNLREAGLAARKHLSLNELSDISRIWRHQMGIETIAVTLGSHGVRLQNESQDIQVSPEKSIDVVDVCGAGDAVICSLALGIMSRLTLDKCGELANLTGAFVCSQSGVVAVDLDEIYALV